MTHKTVKIGENNIELLSALGQGTYGSVYLIKDKDTTKAIKIITNSGSQGIKSLREIDVMSRLRHPNLVLAEGIIVGIEEKKVIREKEPTMLGVKLPPLPTLSNTLPKPTEKNITVGIIMPLAATDLQKLLRDPTFTLDQRIKVLYDILKGVKFFHDSGYLHMDLKPMNILIFNENQTIVAKITDFGISLLMDSNGKKYYPIELVTVTHRAPEILAGNRTYTRASDMWSLGIIFLEVLSMGKPIYANFEKRTIIDTNTKYFSSKNIIQTLTDYFKDLPEPTKTYAIQIVSKMLSPYDFERPSVEEVMASPLFYLYNDTNHGDIKYKRPYPPRKCDPIYYYGYDLIIRLATKLSLHLETIFLAADIYQRALAFGHHLTGNFKKDWGNVALTAAASLYMAIKIVESYSPDAKVLSNLTSNVFLPDDIIKVEASLTQLFEGMLYSKNLFTESVSEEKLKYAFDNLLRNCHLYHKIDLNRWRMNDQGIPYDKNVMFNNFVKSTEYYKLINGRISRSKYLPQMYEKDLKAMKR